MENRPICRPNCADNEKKAYFPIMFLSYTQLFDLFFQLSFLPHHDNDLEMIKLVLKKNLHDHR